MKNHATKGNGDASMKDGGIRGAGAISTIMSDPDTPQKAKSVVQSAMAQFMADFIADGLSRMQSEKKDALDGDAIRKRYDDESWPSVETALKRNGFSVTTVDGKPKVVQAVDASMSSKPIPDDEVDPETGFTKRQIDTLRAIMEEVVSERAEELCEAVNDLDHKLFMFRRDFVNHVRWT